jgi:flagellar biosynthesis/type III secretory pathway M-ring protein FliF/YscJ
MATSTDSNEKKIKMLYGVIGALAVLLIIMAVLLSRQKTEYVELVSEHTSLTVERNDLEAELQEMLTQYDALTVDNEELSAEIIQQKEEIASLMQAKEGSRYPAKYHERVPLYYRFLESTEQTADK